MQRSHISQLKQRHTKPRRGISMKKEKESKVASLWIVVSHIDMPRSNWIWWVIEGTVEAPGEGSRSFNSQHALQDEIEERGYKVPTSTQLNEAVLQASVEGKDDATLEVSPT